MKKIATLLRKVMILKSDEQAVWALVMGMISFTISIFPGLFLFLPLLYYDHLNHEELKNLKYGMSLIVGAWFSVVIGYIVLGILGKLFGRTEKINW